MVMCHRGVQKIKSAGIDIKIENINQFVKIIFFYVYIIYIYVYYILTIIITIIDNFKYF